MDKNRHKLKNLANIGLQCRLGFIKECILSKYDYINNQIHTHGSKQSYSQGSRFSHGSDGDSVIHKMMDAKTGGGGRCPPTGPAYTVVVALNNRNNATITASSFFFMINFPFHHL